MSKVVPYKFEVVAICQVLDDDGRIIAEQPAGAPTPDGSLAPVTVFGVEGLVAWAQAFDAQIERAAGEPRAEAA